MDRKLLRLSESYRSQLWYNPVKFSEFPLVIKQNWIKQEKSTALTLRGGLELRVPTFFYTRIWESWEEREREGGNIK